MKRKTPELFTGITLEKWQSDPENIRWAHIEPRFQMQASVLLNEAHRAHELPNSTVETVRGYHLAVQVFRSMGYKPPKEVPEVEDKFDERPQNAFKTDDVRD